ncbi:MAG TPA: EAL domain-containing protein [Stellaceae bacterium]|nr:EAL domain-containing protein [Stellaceae bacterium]
MNRPDNPAPTATGGICAIGDTHPHGIAIADDAGRVTWANRDFARTLKQSKARLIGRKLASILPPEADEIVAAIDARDNRRRQIRIAGESAADTWLDIDLQSIAGKDGLTGLICLVRDVSGAMASCRESEATRKRLSLAVESAHVGLWDWDVAGGRFWTNPQWWRYLGFETSEAIPEGEMADGDLAELLLHPDDLPRIRSDRAAFCAGTEEQLSSEMRQRDASGQWRWISSTGRVTHRGADGRPARISGVYVDIHERKMASERIAFAAHHDTLTGLANRTEVKVNLVEGLARWQRTGEPFWVFALDLDRFKAVNDTYGHAIGDAMLQAVARRIKAVVREGDVVARLGGDEFSILVRAGGEGGAFAETIAARLLESLSQPYSISGMMIHLGASIGIAKAPDHGRDAETLMRNAETALYKVKADGSNDFRFFDDALEAESYRRRALEAELSGAIERDELELHYQTIVDLVSGRPVGIEALLRWRHRGLGLVLPDHFIPIAEDTGLIVPIGEWVVRRACADAMAWPDDIAISVNVSTAQLGRFGLVEMMADALETSGLPSRRLAVEVTESIFLRDDEAMLQELNRLRGMGVKLVLDDFGTGYASLGYLRRLRFDRIKIDKSFIADAGRDPHATAVARAIANLAESLGMECIAEGIETEMQAELMRAAGCQLGQGHLFSRPAPLDKLGFGH